MSTPPEQIRLCPWYYYRSMASWTDGAAYAPIERPDGFATPEVDPLESATAAPTMTPGAIAPPEQFRMDAPVAPLNQVRTTPPPRRDPSHAFQTGGALMTVASSMGQHDLRDPRTPFMVQRNDGASDDTLPPPTGNPLPGPLAAPYGPPSGMAPWPGSPPASRQELNSQTTLVWLAMACCFLGFTLGETSPYLLLAAGVLTFRASATCGKAGIWALAAGLLLIMVSFVVGSDGVSIYGRLTSLGFAIWFATAALRSRAKLS